MKTALVTGGHGFIGHHLARDLKRQGFWVRTVDKKEFPYGELKKDVDEYIKGDLRDAEVCRKVFKGPDNKPFDEVYALAFHMGGAGFVFSQENDAAIMHHSALIDINTIEACRLQGARKIFLASSACVYPEYNQKDESNPITSEDSAYPADPDSDYGFTKLFGERIYRAYAKNHGLNVKIARFHNVTGMEGAWGNGREKSPAAMCRKVAQTPDGGVIEVWGNGLQTRSYLYIDECLKGIRLFMNSDFNGPVNIGSDEMVSINQLVEMTKKVAGKPNITIKHIEGPIGVRGRTSDNRLIKEKLGWAPDYPLQKCLENLYPWIEKQVKSGVEDCAWSN